jgi:hypothetical protein
MPVCHEAEIIWAVVTVVGSKNGVVFVVVALVVLFKVVVAAAAAVEVLRNRVQAKDKHAKPAEWLALNKTE